MYITVQHCWSARLFMRDDDNNSSCNYLSLIILAASLVLRPVHVRLRDNSHNSRGSLDMIIS